MRMIDTHCHLDAADFTTDLVAVIRRARRANLQGLISVGVAPEHWSAQVSCRERALAEGMAVGIALGTHPWWTDRIDVHDALNRLADGLAQPESIGVPRTALVGIGEIGLDYATGMADHDAQRTLLEGQLDLARQYDLPVVFHARKSEDRLLWYLRRRPGLRGVVHGFTGSEQQARQFIDQGFFLGIGGALTHPRATRMRRMLGALPESALVLETDAPNQPGHAHPGQRNEPAWIAENLLALAAARGVDAAGLAEVLFANALRLFGPAWLKPQWTTTHPDG